MATQWYIVKNGDRRGPYTGEQLQALADDGTLRFHDLVWCEGMTDWVPAKNVLQASRSVPPPRRRREEDDDYEEDRQPAERSQFPGKFVSPGFFLFAVLMFFLPWVDVRCNGFTAASQSGFQACQGDYTESVIMAERRLHNQPGFRLNNERIKPAPLLWVYGLLVVAGLVLGLALPIGKARMIALTVCAVVAFGLMIMQLAIGFPIAEQVAKANADPNMRQQIRNEQPPFPFPQPMFVAGPGQPDFVWVSTTPWFWFGAIVTLGVTAALALEHGVIFAPKRRRRTYDD
jgi:hypothetical protein